MPSIDVDDDVINVLKKNAEVFVDSPNSVLRKLLGLGAHDNGHASPNGAEPAAAPTRPQKGGGTTAASAKPKGARAMRGTLLPESEYEMPILRYLAGHGGRAPSREVVDAVGEVLADRLTDADRLPLNSGEIRWKSRAAFVRLRLIEKGDLAGQAQRGTWEITDQGRARVQA
jgi:hypothetical protein